ncbi:MAG: hypothetical protein WKG01_21290 [Kofleriaceae bacterium]
MSKSFALTLFACALAACGDNGAANPGPVDSGNRADSAVVADAPADAMPDATDGPPPPPVALNVNGDFETGDQSGWICNGGATCTVLNTDAHAGTYAGAATGLDQDYKGFRVNVLPLVCPDDPTCATGTTQLGKTLRFHAFIKPIGAATAIRLVLRWNCPADTMGGYTWLHNINDPVADTWNELMKDFEIPNCNYAGSNENLYLYTGTVGATEIRIDDLAITVAPTGQ